MASRRGAAPGPRHAGRAEGRTFRQGGGVSLRRVGGRNIHVRPDARARSGPDAARSNASGPLRGRYDFGRARTSGGRTDTCEANLDSMDWSDLTGELDAWRDEGRTASLWWRDDDAVAPAPALDRLAALAHEHEVTVGLAVIPALAEPALAPWLGSARAEVLQHGWAHRSHAAPGEKKTELGSRRAPDDVTAELSRGFRRLGGIAGDQLRPVLVPPWNRIDPGLIPSLPLAGFCGLFDVRSPRRRGARSGAQAGELPRRRGGLAGRTGLRRVRPGPRVGGRTSRGPARAVGGSGRADRVPDPSRRPRGVHVDVHRPVPRMHAAPSGGPLARAGRGDTRMTEHRSGTPAEARSPDEQRRTSLRLAARLRSGDVRVEIVGDGDHRLSRDADLSRLARTLHGVRAEPVLRRAVPGDAALHRGRPGAAAVT